MLRMRRQILKTTNGFIVEMEPVYFAEVRLICYVAYGVFDDYKSVGELLMQFSIGAEPDGPAIQLRIKEFFMSVFPSITNAQLNRLYRGVMNADDFLEKYREALKQEGEKKV